MESKDICTFMNFTVTQSFNLGKPVYQIRNNKGEVFSGDYESLNESLRIMREIEKKVKTGEIRLE